MSSTVHTKRQLRGALTITAVGAAVGFLFSLFYWGFGGPMLNGAILGAVIGLISGYFENYIFQQSFRRKSFLAVLLIRSLFYVALIGVTVIVEIKLYRNIRYDIPLTAFSEDNGFMEFLVGGEFLAILTVCIAASVLLNFLRQVNRLLGQNALAIYFTGRYHKPREEERIFMFLDMKSSTTIAEQLGNIRFHELLNDFFFDVTDPIVDSKGSIYQYVGDEIVVTWKMDRGLTDANCIRCFFNALDKIESAGDMYREKYGFVPEFKAGLHYGKVIIGEIGDVKKEIAFHGDPVNTTARIQAECNAYGVRILVSGDLVARLPKGNGFVVENRGGIVLRGKQQEVELYAVSRG